jgi:hypothetical protein
MEQKANKRKIDPKGAAGAAAAALFLCFATATVAAEEAQAERESEEAYCAEDDPSAAVFAFPQEDTRNGAPALLALGFDFYVDAAHDTGASPYNAYLSINPESLSGYGADDTLFPADQYYPSGEPDCFPALSAAGGSSDGSGGSCEYEYFDFGRFWDSQFPGYGDFLTEWLPQNPGSVAFAIMRTDGSLSSSYLAVTEGGLIGVGFPSKDGGEPTASYATVGNCALDNYYSD